MSKTIKAGPSEELQLGEACGVSKEKVIRDLLSLVKEKIVIREVSYKGKKQYLAKVYAAKPE